jgi:hypothetical protein
MKGPIPEADAKMSNRPKTSSKVTIGMSHQRLRAHKKESNSPTTPKLDDIERKNTFMFYSTNNKSY